MKTKTIPNTPNVVMVSIWKDDTQRRLEERVEHLLAKSYPKLRFVWVVGDSSDGTEDYLRSVAAQDKRATVLRHDTNIAGDDPDTRLERMSLTINAGFQTFRKTDKYAVIHESDLVSPVDVVEQFIATGKEVVGGFVWLGNIFYDTYAYRKNGRRFDNHAPFHPEFDMNSLNELDCIGSCWMFPTAAKISCLKYGVIELCGQLKEKDYSIWCDPRIRIEQPVDLWTSRSHANA